MKFVIIRDHLLKPLQQVSNLLVGRPILPILNNLLLEVMKDCLLLIGTDLEIEIMARVILNTVHKLGTATVPAKKFFDICRSFPEGSEITVMLENNRILIFSGQSRYFLSTLPVNTFPRLDSWESKIELTLSQETLKLLIESTQFSMAHQDVRYYLNGMLFETQGEQVRTVATDGHRLALCAMPINETLTSYSVIVPRKGILELMRVLGKNKNPVKLRIGESNICANFGDYVFNSKLINGRFPNYRRVFPKNPDKILKVGCDALKQALSRAAILSNEKFRGVRLCCRVNQLKITVNNLEKEEAEEILNVYYEGDDLEIGFNVNYILDVLQTLKCEKVKILLTDGISSVQIEDCVKQVSTYIVMPMRL